VKEFNVHHQKYIDEWHKYEQNIVRIFCMHTDKAFRGYLGWYQRATRIKLHQRWTDEDYTNGGSSDDKDTVYDTGTGRAHMLSRVPF
jgi:hypothetical protein